MKRSAVIYSYQRQKALKFIFKSFFVGGILAVLLLFSPLLLVEVEYKISRILPQKEKVVIASTNISSTQTFQDLINNKTSSQTNANQSMTFGDLASKRNLEIMTPVDPSFSLIIPKINVNSKIIPQVSAADKTEYETALQNGVAHAKGTFFPGQGGTVYLFGHSTDYIWDINRFNAVFYLIKELTPGDEIDVFYNNKHYVYAVEESKIVEADEIYYLKPKKDKEEIVLQTCWPPGTTWKRLLVFAKPKVETNLLSYSP